MDNIRLILLFSPKESENAMKKRVYTLYRVSTKGQVEKDDMPTIIFRLHFILSTSV